MKTQQNNNIETQGGKIIGTPKKPSNVTVYMSMANNGFVTFGGYQTEKGQLVGSFTYKKPIKFSAKPAKGYRFRYWKMKHHKEDEYTFITDTPEWTIERPNKNLIIRAFFEPIID